MRVAVASFVFWTLIAFILFPVLIWYGPQLEEKWFPVLADQSAKATREGNHLIFTVEATKTRQCRLAQVGFSLIRQKGIVVERMPIGVTAASGAAIGSATYPTGHFVMGPFVADLPDGYEDATAIDGSLYYDCHWGWWTHQVYGPVTIPATS